MLDKVRSSLGTSLVKKIQTALLWLLLISLLIGLIRQILIQRSVDQRIRQRQEELTELERKNQELKAKLQDSQSPEFTENQLRKMLGLPPKENITSEIPDLRLQEKNFVPKYKQWWDLFVY